MSDVRDLFKPAYDYLPEDVAADLSLASTTCAWWMRLRFLIEADREEIAKLQAENARLEKEHDEWKALAQIHAEDRNEALRKGNELKGTVEALEVKARWLQNDRDAASIKIETLEAENRVVRELVEDALDRLWVRDKEGYQFIYDRCPWMMGEAQEKPLDAEAVLERLGARIEVLNVTTDWWAIRAGGQRVGVYSFESSAVADATVLSKTIAQTVRQATDPLLARIAALTREYQDYMTIADHCTKVYDHFSGGRISKPFTLPEEVIAVAEQIQDEDFEKWGKEHLEVALEPIRARLREWVDLWWKVPAVPAQACNDLAIWIEETFKEKL